MCLLLLASTTINAENKNKKHSFQRFLSYLRESVIEATVNTASVLASLWTIKNIYHLSDSVDKQIQTLEDHNNKYPQFKYPKLQKPSILDIANNLHDYSPPSLEDREELSTKEQKLHKKLNQFKKKHSLINSEEKWQQETEKLYKEIKKLSDQKPYENLKNFYESTNDLDPEDKLYLEKIFTNTGYISEYTSPKPEELDFCSDSEKAMHETLGQLHTLYTKKLASDRYYTLNKISEKINNESLELNKKYHVQIYKHKKEIENNVYNQNNTKINKNKSEVLKKINDHKNKNNKTITELAEAFSHYRAALAVTAIKSCAVIFGLQMIVKPTWRWMRKEFRNKKQSNGKQ